MNPEAVPLPGFSRGGLNISFCVSGFASPTLWRSGHGVGSDRQFLADVNGDRRADAVVYFNPLGESYAALVARHRKFAGCLPNYDGEGRHPHSAKSRW